MPGGEMEAAFKGLAADANRSAAEIAQSLARLGEQTAEREESAVANLAEAEARNTRVFDDLRSGHTSGQSTSTEQAAPRNPLVGESAPEAPTGARGPASGREYDPAAAGGPVQHLDASSATVSRDGLDAVESHLRRFTAGGQLDSPEQGMVDRLRAITAGELAPTHYDLNFYTHELREASRYANLGYGPESAANLGSPDMYDVWNNVHTASLEDYRISGGDLYHPDVAP